MKQHERQKFQKLINRRTAILGGIKFSLFAALAGRLYFLQVEEAEKYAQILGYNYKSSKWYENSYSLFDKTYKVKKESRFKKSKKKTKKITDKFKSLIERDE